MHKICFDPLLGILNVKKERLSLQFCISCLIHFTLIAHSNKWNKIYIHCANKWCLQHTFTLHTLNKSCFCYTTEYFEWSFWPFLFFNRAAEANFAIFPPLIRMFHWAKFLCLPSSGLEYQITNGVPSDTGLVPERNGGLNGKMPKSFT